MVGRSARSLLQLLPRGAAWARSLDGTLGTLLEALAGELERIEDRALQLLRESLPSTVEELVDEWAVATRSREVTVGAYALGSVGIRPVIMSRLYTGVLSPARIRRWAAAHNDQSNVDPLVNYVRVDRDSTHEVTVLLECSESLVDGFQRELRALAQVHGTVNVAARPHTDNTTLELEHLEDPLEMEHEFEALAFEENTP